MQLFVMGMGRQPAGMGESGEQINATRQERAPVRGFDKMYAALITNKKG